MSNQPNLLTNNSISNTSAIGNIANDSGLGISHCSRNSSKITIKEEICDPDDTKLSLGSVENLNIGGHSARNSKVDPRMTKESLIKSLKLPSPPHSIFQSKTPAEIKYIDYICNILISSFTVYNDKHTKFCKTSTKSH